MIEVRLI